MQTRQIVLASRPDGWVVPENFAVREADMPLLDPGDVLVRHLYMSVDPYMRGLMNDGGVAYAAGFQIGQPLFGRVIGVVESSRNKDFREGDCVFGMLDWAERSVARGGESLRVVDPAKAPLSHYLGTLGFPGLTAYVGMTLIGQPKEGETVYVSAASGAVGQVAGQLARIAGARVIGSAGTDEKVRFVVGECGFHDGFNYRTVPSIPEALRLYCADGIDVNFENVGGANLDAVLVQANPFARFAMCGMISQYNEHEPYHLKNLNEIVSKRLNVQGFVVRDHSHLIEQFIEETADHIAAGRMTVAEDITNGLENAPAAFIGMLKGENFGKQVVKVGEL
ncbi:MAG: NADP-dependent oxidoreductase [Minwuia sp.]|uniref:NADP-dependent oxidoreductase n=1 Tax=Minwuia sp. TaxID=2493630 RepID=UPI003A8707F1